jgi:acyl carrier protein
MSQQPGQLESAIATAEPEQRERKLRAVVGGLVRELHPRRSRFIDIAPSSRIERDLGIDSLGRTELILRIERAFRVRLPAQTIGEAETVRDLIWALEQAKPESARITAEGPPVPVLSPVEAATEERTLIEVLEWHAARHPDRLHVTVIQDEATVLGSLTYGELAARARNLASGLIVRDVGVGDRIGLMLPTKCKVDDLAGHRVHGFIAFRGELHRVFCR